MSNGKIKESKVKVAGADKLQLNNKPQLNQLQPNNKLQLNTKLQLSIKLQLNQLRHKAPGNGH